MQLGRRPLETLRDLGRDREAELLYDEVDLAEQDGLLVHRLLFWPRDEVSIWFRALELQITPRADRTMHLGGAFYEDESESAE